MDDQSNRKPCRAQFKLTQKRAKLASNRFRQARQWTPLDPIEGLREATTRDYFLLQKQADGVATTGGFSSPEAIY